MIRLPTICLTAETLKKGGRIERKAPHYMVVEHSPWLGTWFEDCAFIKIPIEEFDWNTISFTYGHSHPTFSPRVTDGKEYCRKLIHNCLTGNWSGKREELYEKRSDRESYAVFGLGEFGKSVALELMESSNLIIDQLQGFCNWFRRGC